VLLAAAQNPLLGEHHFAKALLPRLCSIILSAPKATRHLLVKWWSDYPGALLEPRVVAPLQVSARRRGRGGLWRRWLCAAACRAEARAPAACPSRLLAAPPVSNTQCF
jgi:hypothetical protein